MYDKKRFDLPVLLPCNSTWTNLLSQSEQCTIEVWNHILCVVSLTHLLLVLTLHVCKLLNGILYLLCGIVYCLLNHCGWILVGYTLFITIPYSRSKTRTEFFLVYTLSFSFSVAWLWLASWWQPSSARGKTGSIVRKLPVNLSFWSRLLLDRESVLVVGPGSLCLYLFFNIMLRSVPLMTKMPS